jgi:hypothetical protein
MPFLPIFVGGGIMAEDKDISSGKECECGGMMNITRIEGYLSWVCEECNNTITIRPG